MQRPSTARISAIRVRAVRVPMPEPHRTASGVITESPLVLTDVITDHGVQGHSIVFTYTPIALEPTAQTVRGLETLVVGEPLALLALDRKLAARCRLLGTQHEHESSSGGRATAPARQSSIYS